MSTPVDRGKHSLFDSHGHHIAVVIERHLYNRAGRHIGQYLPQYGVFIDHQGRYLGEVVHSDRLLYNLLSPCRTTNFGVQHRSRSRVCPVGETGPREAIGNITGYTDIIPALLGS